MTTTKQVDLTRYKNDITNCLDVEKYIKSEFKELTPKNNFYYKKSYATITNVSIIFNSKLKITISYNGQKYITKVSLNKENIEYLCGLTNIKEFKIDEIIGSKIKFTNQINDSLIICKKYSFHNTERLLRTLFYIPASNLIIFMSPTVEFTIINAVIGTIIFLFFMEYLPYKNISYGKNIIFKFEKLSNN